MQGQYSDRQQELIRQLWDAAMLLQGSGRLSNEEDPFRAILYVEGVGLFISRDWAYGVVDLDMAELEKRFPGKVVYKLGVAEPIR